MDVSLGHLCWPLDEEGGAGLCPCVRVQRTPTPPDSGWAMTFLVLNLWQEHNPHLGRAPSHVSLLMPVVSSAARLSRVQDSPFKHPHFKTKGPKPLSA